jgi:eukaryotic-like serine/threonine-protein kinase
MPIEGKSAMTPERLREIRILFEQAISGSQSERMVSLMAVRMRDPEIAGEVEALVAAYDRRTGFIEDPIARLGQADPPTIEAGKPIGGWIGPYQLLEIAGEGGMGQVWRAEQTHPVHRIVALKLIKVGMDTHEVVRRFQSERQALAVMDHPAIAKVFDAGSTPTGRPYFAMEYVEGIAITKYCDQQRLTVPDRLRLFVKVCEGIQHAHQKAIIHRDIKPSNVLIAKVDGKPVPKIIDFGVARAISPESLDDTTLTRHGTVLGTPNYMSPEQASPLGSPVDTRTDVYSLGALVYELLVGVMPHQVLGLSLQEALRKIREEPVERPSARYRALGMDGEVAAKRQTSAPALYKELSGDLDTVILKALKRNPDNRYESASELAADLGRYLHREPIQARPPSALYLTRKYVRRHWVSVMGVAAASLLAAAFGIWQNIELHRITRERDRADRVSQFMSDMFQVSDPSENRGNQITAREILDRSSAGIEQGLSDDPELQAKLMSLMGRVYYGLGLYSRAETLFRHSLSSRLRLAGPNSLDAAQSRYDLATVLRATANRTEAKSLDLQTLEIRKRLLGEDHPETLKAMNSLAADWERDGAYDQARQLQEVVYRADARVLGPEHLETLVAMEHLGELLFSEGRLSEAAEFAHSALDKERHTLGPDHPETLAAIHLLADILCDEGRYGEAETLLRELLTARTKVLGPGHRDTLNAMKALAVALDWQGRLAEAEELERKVVAGETKLLAPDDPNLLLAMSDLAHILSDREQHAEAESLSRKVLETSRRSLGAENPRTLYFASSLTSILLPRGSLEEADRIASQTRDAQIRLLGRGHAQTVFTTYTLARINARRGRADQALSLLHDAVDHGLSASYLRKLAQEPNLRPLHDDPRFYSLVLSLPRSIDPAKQHGKTGSSAGEQLNK